MSFLASPDTLTDYSTRGYTGWLILANSHFNSVRLDGLPATGNLSLFGKEANNTMATLLLCQPNVRIAAARVQYGSRRSMVHLSGNPLVGNIDQTQVCRCTLSREGDKLSRIPRLACYSPP